MVKKSPPSLYPARGGADLYKQSMKSDQRDFYGYGPEYRERWPANTAVDKHLNVVIFTMFTKQLECRNTKFSLIFTAP